MLDQIGDQRPLDIRSANGRSNGLRCVCTPVTLGHQLSATGDADTASFDQLDTSAAHNIDLQQKSVAIGSGLVTQVPDFTGVPAFYIQVHIMNCR